MATNAVRQTYCRVIIGKLFGTRLEPDFDMPVIAVHTKFYVEISQTESKMTMEIKVKCESEK